MMRRSLLVLLTCSTAAAAPYSLRNGLTNQEWQVIASNTGGQIEGGYTIIQTIRTPTGDTLVVWARTPALDPKGPRGLGLRWYRKDGSFRRWLPDAALLDRNFVLCDGRSLVGGDDHTLSVQDARKNFALMVCKVISDLSLNVGLRCQDGGVVALNSGPFGRPYALPDLKH